MPFLYSQPHLATSAGQDFVDASGAGGNDYAFKTIPSEVDIARGLMRWLKSQNVTSVATVAAAELSPSQRGCDGQSGRGALVSEPWLEGLTKGRHTQVISLLLSHLSWLGRTVDH
jgi:hypothetical protein